MIIKLMDGPMCIGIGRDVDDAARKACEINRLVGDQPTDPIDMKALIDAGAIKVREQSVLICDC